ncbi:MAG: alpha/beta hydrolase [Planctomycetaceae bacterium]|nr:alpha/beta hydrolase [Planctomycetaceae bacterium]
MARTALITDDNVAINMFELKSGTGPDMLMLHGVGRAGRTFSAFAAMLPDQLRISAIDFRGHGNSGRADGRYLVADYVHDAAAALNAIGRPTIVYGHSLGALAAVSVAAKLPRSVSAIVLEDPPSAAFWKTITTTNYHPTFVAMRTWASRTDLSTGEIALQLGDVRMLPTADGRIVKLGDVRDAVSLRFTASCLRQLDPLVMQAVLEQDWQAGLEFEASLAAVSCPVLLLRGNPALGGMLPEEDAKRFAGQTRDCTRIDVPTAGHLLHLQARVDASSHTSAFIESL